MFCNECGAKNPNTAKFCSECGMKFVQAVTAEAKASGLNNNDFFDMFEEVVPEKEISVEDRLASLSTAGMLQQNKVASATINPIKDPYWDDVLPEIDNEIYAIPKDNIIKVLASIGALFIVIVYLIFML